MPLVPEEEKPVVDQQVLEPIHVKEENMVLESTVKTEKLDVKMETTEFSSTADVKTEI